uniref:Uncharacterized protein n=1 Tax=Fundulus heteroclitus TaxID=8078 RepID=A0A3Q2NR18_FUNHE
TAWQDPQRSLAGPGEGENRTWHRTTEYRRRQTTGYGRRQTTGYGRRQTTGYGRRQTTGYGRRHTTGYGRRHITGYGSYCYLFIICNYSGHSPLTY